MGRILSSHFGRQRAMVLSISKLSEVRLKGQSIFFPKEGIKRGLKKYTTALFPPFPLYFTAF
jgi:hypothetical protein